MANNILEMALEQLDFPPSTISAWFDDVTVVSFGDNRLVLHSPVPFKKEFIESKFITPLQEVLHNLTGDPITVVVVTGEYTAPSTSTSPYDDYTFERFIAEKTCNKFVSRFAVGILTVRNDKRRQIVAVQRREVEALAAVRHRDNMPPHR